MKKALSLFLSLVLVLGIMFSVPIVASATSKTQSEAVAWANSKIGGSWDQDGFYGAQCIDLIRFYYEFLGTSAVLGNACDYATNTLPEGWQRIKYSSGVIPKPGDIAVWTYSTSANGHAAIVTSANSSRMYVVEQNGSTQRTRSHSYRYSYGTLWGFIRPDFSGGSSSSVEAPACDCSESYAGTYICIADGGNVNIRAGHGTGYSVVGSVPPEAEVTISKATGTDDDSWGHVTYNGINGYVSMKYFERQQEKYTISYNANGGSGAPAAQSKVQGTALTLSSTKPTRSGYTFLGWATSAKATTATYTAGAKYTTDKSVNLYAVWKSNAPKSEVETPVTSAINALNGISVTWSEVSGAVNYVVYRRAGGSSTWVKIGSTTELSMVDTSPKSGTYYLYSVRAYNSKGSYSAYDSTKTKLVQYVLAPYTIATNIVGGVSIDWGSVGGASKYAVFRRRGGQSVWQLVETTTGNNVKDCDVQAGIYYAYSVRAINGTGYSAYNGKKTDVIQPITAPEVTARENVDCISVEWEAVTGVTRYNVYRRCNNSGWVLISTTTDNCLYDNEVETGNKYTYSVRAINGTGYSAYETNKTDFVHF